MERETRFELATPTLARLYSTTELFPLVALKLVCPNGGGVYAEGRNRSSKKDNFFLFFNKIPQNDYMKCVSTLTE
jgi:hypothetical protein